jgi:hypothetical protein
MYEVLPCERVIAMRTGHSPFLAAPRELAAHLLSLVLEDQPGAKARRDLRL